MKIEQDE